MSFRLETLNLKLFCSTVYGPVTSWRLGRSLGVDLLCVDSVCSFRCVYCQLGRINVRTAERKVYVETARVVEDLRASAWRGADAVTFSGSGEPTLALNLGECVSAAKELTGLPAVVLTNSAHLRDPSVRRELCEADGVFCKLDAADEETLRRVNRPVPAVTLDEIVSGLRRFRAEFEGRLAVQVMLLPLSAARPEALAALLASLRPDEVQLNRPTRPVPRAWHPEARTNSPSQCGVRLRSLGPDDAERYAETLRRLTGLRVVTAPRAS